MSVRDINKFERELGFVLMAPNIRKVVAQLANYNQNDNEKDNFYISYIEIVFFYLSKNFIVLCFAWCTSPRYYNNAVIDCTVCVQKLHRFLTRLHDLP